MLSAGEVYLQESLQEFSTGLNLYLPLRHHCEYYDSETIKNVAQLESSKTLQKFLEKIKHHRKKRDLEKEFHSGIEKRIEEYEGKNQDCREKSEGFLKKLVEDVCKYFKSTTEAQFLLAPEMDLKRTEKLLETGKEMAIKYFDSHSSYGYAGLYENQKQKLGQELDNLGTEMLEQQRRHLKAKADEEETKSMEKLERVVVDMIKQVPLTVSKRIRLKKVEEIQKYLIENGGTLMNGKHGKVFSELLKFDADGSLPAEDIAKWVEGLELEVQSDVENGLETQTPDMRLEQEAEATSNLQLEYTEETIKEEVVEVENESSDLEVPQEMDIDIKIELDGLVLQKSCLKPVPAIKRSHHNYDYGQIQEEGNENGKAEEDARISKRQKFCMNQATDSHSGMVSEEGATATAQITEGENVARIQIVSCVGRTTSTEQLNPNVANDGSVSDQNEYLMESSRIRKITHASMKEKGKELEARCSVPMFTDPRNEDKILENRDSSKNVDFMVGRTSKENQCIQRVDEEKVRYEIVEPTRDVRTFCSNGIRRWVSWTEDQRREHRLSIQQNNIKDAVIDSRSDDCGNDNSNIVSVGRKRQTKSLIQKEDLKAPSAIVTPLKSKKLAKEVHCNLNAPYKNGNFSILRAICQGHNATFIKKMLDDGADVNLKRNDNFNAAHAVIKSLISRTLNRQGALAILNLLIARGFNGLNGMTKMGSTPLYLAMEYEELNEELLTWFYENGADFNALEHGSGNSVLLQALRCGQKEGVIQNILNFGGDVKHVNRWKSNALHLSARYANEFALRLLIDLLPDVNARDIRNWTPLHYLFSEDDLDYFYSLQMLLSHGADVEAECDKCDVPLVHWVRYGGNNVYRTVMKSKDLLLISPQIASVTLVAIVEQIGGQLSKYSPSDMETNDLAAFIRFLIEEKKSTFAHRLNCKYSWKQQNWGKLEKTILTGDFLNELNAVIGCIAWKGGRIQIKASVIGWLSFFTNCNDVPVAIETIILCVLECKNYNGLAKICRLLVKSFCTIDT